MNEQELFGYINIVSRYKDEFKSLINALIKLNKARKIYSIQELESINILDDNMNKDNFRILNDVITFIEEVEKAEVSSYLNLTGRNDVRKNERLSTNILEKNIDEHISVDLSSLQKKIITIADISFKANKYTKKICEKIKEIICGNNKCLRDLIGELKRIYNRNNNETQKRENIDEELGRIYKEVINGAYSRKNGHNTEKWDDNFKASNENTFENFRKLYDDLAVLWDVENILYEIKSKLNSELLKGLIKDNCTDFQDWGFSQDENNMWVLNFDYDETTARYSYHIPDLGKIVSKELKRKITGVDKRYNYLRSRMGKSVKKYGFDRVKRKIAAKDFLRFFKQDIHDLLDKLNINNINSRVNDDIFAKLYNYFKFVGNDFWDKFIELYPELKLQYETVKAIANSRNQPLQSEEVDDNLKNRSTEYEEKIRNQIEQNLKENRRIFIQYGKNIDINASIYALRRHMKEKFGIEDIEIVRINAGENLEEYRKKGIIIDAGNLIGNIDFNENYRGTKVINANASRAQKSSCAELSRFGIYVPKKIVQYADTVITDEKVLDARYGVNLARYLDGEELFRFAEAKDEDGTYIMEKDLNDEELVKFNLFEQYKKRDAQIKDAISQISENIYKIKDENGEERYIAILDHMINSGAMVAYGLGCDYYLSLADKQPEFITDSENLFNISNKPQITFSVMANPKKGNGRLPEQFIKWCEELRDRGKNDVLELITVGNTISKEKQQPFIKPTKDMIVFGGPKTPNLFVTLKEENIVEDENPLETVLYEITDQLGASVIPEEEKQNFIKKGIKTWQSISAKELVYRILGLDIDISSTKQSGRNFLKDVNVIEGEKDRNE